MTLEDLFQLSLLSGSAAPWRMQDQQEVATPYRDVQSMNKTMSSLSKKEDSSGLGTWGTAALTVASILPMILKSQDKIVPLGQGHPSYAPAPSVGGKYPVTIPDLYKNSLLRGGR